MMAMAAASCLELGVGLVLFLLVVSVKALKPKELPSLSVIRKVNNGGPYIGVISVYSREEDAFFSTAGFKPDPQRPYLDLSGRRFRFGKIHGKRVIYVRCGIGMVNAAAATQQMEDLFDVVGIVHFGIAGNVNNSMSIGDVVILKQVANTGIWNWLKMNGTLELDSVAHLDFGAYNVPKGNETNMLGRISFSPEDFYSESRDPNTSNQLLWAQTTPNWLHLASRLQGMKLKRCVNSTLCLPHEPKLVIGLSGSTANIFVDNDVYRDFLFHTFNVTSVDMETSAILMTCLSNGYPVIVIRGLSDLAGAQTGESAIRTFGSLAALNTANVVLKFINMLPSTYHFHY